MKKDEASTLQEVRRLLHFLSSMYSQGKLSEISTSTIEELADYLRPLSESNQVADSLEDFCVAAIWYYRSENMVEYVKHLKLIIRHGKSLL